MPHPNPHTVRGKALDCGYVLEGELGRVLLMMAARAD
jgi:hypothetical protein